MNYDTILPNFKVMDTQHKIKKQVLSEAAHDLLAFCDISLLLFCPKNKSNHCNRYDNAENIGQKTHL
jgi:hypothetical protein